MHSYNRVMWEGVTSGKGGVTELDYARVEPLLVIVGERDHVTPPALGRAIVEKYHASGSAVVEYQEYPGRTHRLVSQDGWGEIADYALSWAQAHATQAPAHS